MGLRALRWVIFVFLVITQIPFTFAEASQVVVKKHAVVRTEPRGSAKRLGTAEPGERFQLLSETTTNRWYLIEYEADSGWIYSRWVDPVDVTPGQKIKIASFNTLHLGWGSTKTLEIVATILAQYDVIALQEVMKKGTLEALADILDSLTSVSWNLVVSEKLGRSSYKESYAFVWRSDRVEKIANSEFVVQDVEDDFSREPYVATFRSGNFDFTLICAHFIYGRSKQDRREEAEAMARVFQAVQDQDPAENDILLLGDFNLPSTDWGWARIKDIDNMIWLLDPPAKTSIGHTGMSDLYDNIWFQSDYVNEYTGEGEAYEFMHEFFEDDKFEKARTYVSDHVPVYAAFRIDQPDDD
jgi:endonuclease/exonuclease/phosphatase family metal-dependent hydrolase